MLIWLLALFLFVCLGVIGFYQGALRVVISFFGLIVAAFLAQPLAPVFNWVMGLFGLEHPVLMAFLGPLVAFIVVLLCFKGVGLAAHRKVDTWYKYKASDTVRLLWERVNSRIGIAVGCLNAFAYLVLLSVVIYVMGYFVMQVRTDERDSFVVKTVAAFARDLRETGMDQAVAAFIPRSKLYYDGADIVADIFMNPLLQNRLSTYPPFLLLNEKPEYKQIASSTEFQGFWQKSPTFQEFRSHTAIAPMVENKDWFINMKQTLDGDFEDLKTYLETGKSAKFDDEAVLGRWDYDGAESFALARKRRPNMPLQEIRRLRLVFGALFKDAQITCAPANKAVFKLPNFALPNLPDIKGTHSASWERGTGGTYTLRAEAGSKDLKVDAVVEGNKMTVTLGAAFAPLAGLTLIFEK